MECNGMFQNRENRRLEGEGGVCGNCQTKAAYRCNENWDLYWEDTVEEKEYGDFLINHAKEPEVLRQYCASVMASEKWKQMQAKKTERQLNVDKWMKANGYITDFKEAPRRDD